MIVQELKLPTRVTYKRDVIKVFIWEELKLDYGNKEGYTLCSVRKASRNG